MPSNFPAGYDDFNEPSIPEETTLSSSGTGTRNHPEHHRDLGDAIEAMQHAMALGDHDHAGTGDFPTQQLKQANTHLEADTDTSAAALHHTLGSGPGQAATGNHIHDYNGPTIINQPYLLCTSSTRPFNPTLGTMIYETDTNRVRVWAVFNNNVAIQGVDSIDSFNRTLPDNLGPTLWEQWYEDGSASHGKMAIPNGTQASWIDQGNDRNRCIARRINPADMTTQTDDQVITWRTGSETIEETLIFTESASNDFYFRMSADRNSYLRLQVGNDWLKLYYTVTGPSGEKQIGHIDYLNTDTPYTQWSGQIKDREFTVYRHGELLTTIKDTKALSAKGASNRGWGIGMMSGDRFLGQTTAATVDWVRIQDVIFFATATRWTLVSVAAVPVVRLLQSKAQKILYTGSTIEWTNEVEDNFAFFNPSVPTDIVIKETGLYLIEVGIQWDPQWVPDVASVSLMTNGVETEVKEQRFMRGNAFTPGFSQTISVQGKMRFAANDVLQVKAKYSAPNNLLDKIFSYFDPASRVNSRIDLHFMSP